MFRDIDNYLVHQSRAFLVILSFVQVAVLGFIDYSIGPEISFSLFYVIPDNFKYVNDTFGHDRGDEVLQTFSKVIRDNVRQSDIISRQGGDEFAGLFPETDFKASEKIIQNLVPVLNRTIQEKGGLLHSVSEQLLL